MAQVTCNDGFLEDVQAGQFPCTEHGGVKNLGENPVYEELPPVVEPVTTVNCNDGTTDTISETGYTTLCEGHGGVADAGVIGKDLTKTQKWIAIIGLTGLAYVILWKAGVFKKV
jgi:hypothetical protein